MKGIHRFTRSINVNNLTRLNVTLFVIDRRFNDTITNSLDETERRGVECRHSSSLTLATMYSASSGESTCSFWATSLKEIFAYDMLIILIPVLITLCRKRMINDQVFSCWNRSAKVSTTSLNRPRFPARTARQRSGSSSRTCLATRPTQCELIVRIQRTFQLWIVECCLVRNITEQ